MSGKAPPYFGCDRFFSAAGDVAVVVAVVVAAAAASDDSGSAVKAFSVVLTCKGDGIEG